ncbi:hypothetical protein Ahy_A05g023854 isoform F [Arachis hypogaea]|uniref:Small hydrophobic protein n=1 Tax=Arachis hypogaea TaxID=3818 RepID=A0A445D4Q3_ARAHY|nr:hypothetical protein Ahy_A05g023854 isoform F [Arachis hypogaea]
MRTKVEIRTLISVTDLLIIFVLFAYIFSLLLSVLITYRVCHTNKNFHLAKLNKQVIAHRQY